MNEPKELHITPASFPSAAELANDLQRAAAAVTSDAKTLAGDQQATSELMIKSLLAVANQVWKIATLTRDSESNERKESLTAQELRKISNAVENLEETLTSAGIKVIDRLNKPFNAGLPEQVVSEEPQEGITKEQIIRTIRPTIMWNQTMVQRGEIDIAVPAARKSL